MQAIFTSGQYVCCCILCSARVASIRHVLLVTFFLILSGCSLWSHTVRCVKMVKAFKNIHMNFSPAKRSICFSTTYRSFVSFVTPSGNNFTKQQIIKSNTRDNRLSPVKMNPSKTSSLMQSICSSINTLASTEQAERPLEK